MKIWITWENQRRNREISSRLKIPLFQLEEIDQIHNSFVKYIQGIYKTAKIYVRTSPRLIVCQNPSIVLSFCTLIYGYLFNRKVVIDAHNAGIFPMEGRSKILMTISRFIQRYAQLTIVTNEALKKVVEQNGGDAYILPDPIPKIKSGKIIELKKAFNILFICSFADDEPFLNVFEAAKAFDDSIHIYVTGNYRKGKVDPKTVSDNVSLLGFIPEIQYVEMLYSVHGTIDLTEREDCLVCGAYESVAAEKPMILSGTRALKKFFSGGAVYTDNSIEGLKSAISKLCNDHSRLSDEVRQLKNVKKNDWAVLGEELRLILNKLSEA